ncbi:poly(A)-specific ribonuclease PARN [Carica papaya]|uniref:poly(A)-specific ribonuclease PARN n=1 Tax=Carica papaya TaxID=3649 RepID=UPI000B8CD321|nr:poly(A)-specific ribonuclease PARN [Carica papaya]
MNCYKRWPLRSFSRALARAHSTTTTSSPKPPSPPNGTAGAAPFPLKQVTKSNFEAALADLRTHVRSADFVAIDLEMTGITSAPWRESFEFDRFDVRYLKVKDSAEKFAVVQFGVCPFRWDPLKNSFISHPHNFFVFPRQELPFDGPSHEFLCQTTSIDFLAKYQFDFNACIHEGVSYLSRRQEEEALRQLNSHYEDESYNSWLKLKEGREKPLGRIADVLFAERMKNRLSEWRDVMLHGGNGWPEIQRSSSNSSQQFQTIFFKMRPALSLHGFTSHQLRLIQLVTRKHFSDLAYVHGDGENFSSSELVVYTESEEDRNLLMKEVKDERRRGAETKIKAAIGFRHVIDLLSSEKKLIVGHNCFLDIAHIYSKFSGPLPSTAEDFVSSVNKYFSHIIDTKILLNADEILQRRMKRSKTSLSSAFALLCPQMSLGSKSSRLVFQQCVEVDVEVDNIRFSVWNPGAKHEAGYDAFMTGYIFAQSCSLLGIDFKLHSKCLAHNEKLQKHINLLYLSWINGVIVDLRTGKKTAESLVSHKTGKRYPPIVFENIALVWGFPSKLKAVDIRECISKAFGVRSVTSVYHVDETAVFIQFSKTELISDFLILMHNLDKNKDPISVLHPLSKLLEGGSTHAATYEAYKEICASPTSKVLFADQAKAAGIKWKTRLEESKLEIEIQEHKSVNEEDNITNHVPDSVEKTPVAKTDNATGSSSYSQLSCDDIADSFSTTEVKQSGVI